MIKKVFIPWNKGKVGVYSKDTLEHWSKTRTGVKLSEETKRKISEANKGGNQTSFKKGHRANLGRKATKKQKEVLSKSHLGIPSYWKGKKNLKLTNEGHPQWKGDNVGYESLHTWISRKLGKPTECEHCGKEYLTGHKIHWANIDHKYKRNLKDWIRLCPLCHRRYDINNGLTKRN